MLTLDNLTAISEALAGSKLSEKLYHSVKQLEHDGQTRIFAPLGNEWYSMQFDDSKCGVAYVRQLSPIQRKTSSTIISSCSSTFTAQVKHRLVFHSPVGKMGERNLYKRFENAILRVPQIKISNIENRSEVALRAEGFPKEHYTELVAFFYADFIVTYRFKNNKCIDTPIDCTTLANPICRTFVS